MFLHRDEGNEGIIKGLGDLTLIKGKQKGFGNIRTYNVPVVLKEKGGHPIRARCLIRVHLFQSSIQFLPSESLG